MIETFLVFEQFLTKTLFPNFCGGVYVSAIIDQDNIIYIIINRGNKNFT